MSKLSNDKKREIWLELGKQLHYKYNINIPLDGLLCAATGSVCVDVIKFDEILIRKFDYEKDNLSMNDFMIKEFGQEFADKFEQLI